MTRRTKREPLRVGICAPSSPVALAELDFGIEKLANAGLAAFVHPQTLHQAGLYAGTDDERAEALHEFARDPSLPVIWAARGGYGALRLLEKLEALDRKHGAPPPGKLYAGFSDSTVLLEYARERWKWSALHASMPGHRGILDLPPAEWKALRAFLAGEAHPLPPAFGKLRWITPAPAKPLEGELAGGNLACLTALLGTPFAPRTEGRILFLEDVTESWSRIDRMVETLALSGALRGVLAIVLGNFLDCADPAPTGLQGGRSKKKLVPIRKSLSGSEAEGFVFGRLFERFGIPVATGVPSGHGPAKFPLPLDARYRLEDAGKGRAALRLLDWRYKGAPHLLVAQSR